MCAIIQQQFNCCFSLRLGSVIFSILLLVIPVSLFVIIPVTANILSLYAFADPSDILQFISFSVKIEAVIFIPRLVYITINILAVITLIIGAYKNNHKLLLPWLIFMTISCIGGTVGSVTVLVFIVCLLHHFTLKLIFVIIFFIVLLITVIWWYFLLCVWSYYKELQEASQKTKQSAV